ncbi:UNVERIFIED_CONTAM: hypothetical protein PYX00_003837 [Menopon gallinae]|uniref:Hflx-type G domain-containing protein n=1 Tax=Menopon gallinae TaxID=328185 RepID=A0AAW2I3D5_9NEOP
MLPGVNVLPRFLGGYFGLLRRNCAATCLCRKISVSVRLNRKFFRPQVKLSRRQSPVSVYKSMQQSVADEVDEDKDNAEDSEFDALAQRMLHIPGAGHRVMVIQPFMKWGRLKNHLTTPELQLEESVTLIKTLRTWEVVDQMTVPLSGPNRRTVFGSGQLESLVKKAVGNSKVTAVFISVNMLQPSQHEFLQNAFRLPVYDRYTIVIHIFRQHARTKESTLQIKLAELPYLRSRLRRNEIGLLTGFGGEVGALNTVWKGKEFHDQLFKEREAKIKAEIEKLRQHRKLIRKSRQANEIPVVAVVGYTNSGKTSLIKALTGREKLEPQDYLFATLDVTVHEGTLPSSMKVLFVDTIGFMSDIPTMLFQSFLTTLEEVRLADVIIHVRDISHPDNVAQNQNVKEALNLLELPEVLKNNMITVGNKIDKLPDEELDSFRSEGMIFISALKMIGTDYLLQKVEEYVMKLTDRKIITMKVRTAGEEYQWLQENTTVLEESVLDENSVYSLMKVIITDIAMERFKHMFIKEYLNTKRKA